MVAQRISDVLQKHVTLELECIDRLYLNGYVPGLQYIGGVLRFLRHHLGLRWMSTAVLAPITKKFVASIERFALEEGIDLLAFPKGQRKDDIAKHYLDRFEWNEGVLFIGKAQEKTALFRTEKRTDAKGLKYPWIVRGSAPVNHYYFYVLDEDFGPLFLKFCSYFPYGLKVCLNGHEWLKRQLEKRGIQFEALDNGLLSTEDAKRAQRIANQLDDKKIRAVVSKWLRRLPSPYRLKDKKAGYSYDLSILQAEFSLTQVFDCAKTGRVLFEQMLRENLDLGRPDRIQLLFDRRVTKKTPGSFRTRVLTKGVLPSLRVQYKHSGLKQYYKEDRALRTEFTANDTRDFGIGKRLHNLSDLRQVGFQANRRLLRVQAISHDCTIGHEILESLNRPLEREGQKASALRVGDPRATAVLQALTMFCTVTTGFSNRELREHVARLLDIDPADYKPGRMTYELRRLRLRGLIRRIPHTHRYEVTELGLRVAFFYSRIGLRVLRPALSLRPTALPDDLPAPPAVLLKLEEALMRLLKEAHLSAA